MFFKMEKLNDKISKIKDYSLCVISAPVGSGKTTILVDKLQELELKYIWINLNEEKDDNYVWSEILRELSIDTSKVGGCLPLLNNEIKIVNDKINNIFDYHIYVVLNNYDDNNLSGLSTFISKFELSNKLRFIVVGNKITDSNILEHVYSDKCLWISATDFRVTEKEIKKTAESNQIYLTKKEITELLVFSEGWLIAVNLCLQAYNQTGNIYSLSTLYDYIDSELLKEYSLKVKTDLAKLSIVNEFSIELATAICENGESIDFILENEMNNIIIKKVGYNKYFFTSMLKEYFGYYLSKHQENTERLYRNAGQWYVNNDMPIKAIAIFLKGGLFEEILDIITKSEDSFMDMVPSLIQEVYRKIPQKCNIENPYAYLRYIADCVTNIDYYSGIKLLENFKKDFDEGKYKGDSKQLEGEYYYVRAFSKFNDVGAMMEDFHLAYDCFGGGKSRVAYPSMVATFGSCHLLYLYHKDSGELGKLVKEIQREVGYYVHISHGVNAGSGKLVEAEYNFETGNYNEVISLAKAAYQEGSLSKQTSVCIAALFLEGRYMILKRNYAEVAVIMEKLAEIRDGGVLPILVSEVDCALGYLNIIMNKHSEVAIWIKDSKLKDVALLHEASSLSYVLLMMYHLSIEDYESTLVFAEYLENYCEHQMHVFGLMYAKLGKFIAYHYALNKEKATANLEELISLASKDNIKTIFIEVKHLTKPLLDLYEIPNPFYQTIKDMINATQNEEGTLKATLTVKELEVIRAFIKLMTVQETANNLCISKNTVKTHLKKIYSKLGISSKSELIEIAKKSNIISIML